MKITEVHFTRKINLGNYETEDIGFVATVSATEDAMEVLKELDSMTKKYRERQFTKKENK
jgi:hypothetical protein